MIKYHEETAPFLSKETSGDFSLVLEDENIYFIGVGDIGGHGSGNIYNLAQDAKELMRKKYSDSLFSLLHTIHKQTKFKDNGMVLFIAKIYKKTPILEYINIGNINANILSKVGVVKKLNSQDGIVAYTIPSDIQTNLIKLSQDDKIIIATDGVSSSLDFNQISMMHSCSEISSFVIKKFSHISDDSLCLTIKYEYSLDDMNNLNVKDTPIVKNILDNPKIKKVYKTEIKKKIIKQNIQKIDEKYFLYKLNNCDKKYKDKLYEIFSFCKINEDEKKRYLAFLYEIKLKFNSNIEIYLSEDTLQINFKIEDEFLEICTLFFKEYRYKAKLFMTNINIDGFKYIDERVYDFKELLNFSLDRDSLEMNKKLKIEVDKKVKELLESEKLQFELSQKAYLDKLTCVYNRHKFEEIFNDNLNNYKRYNFPFSIAIIDIDHFKNFNDKYGHQIGDEVLQMLSKCVLSIIRDTDTFARWGGEEFVILYTGTSYDDALFVSDKVREQIANLQHKTAGTITASFGVSEVLADDDMVSFVARADEALYRAKENGRNRVEGI
ncbi:MAG: hypothetical protein DRG78_14345 [Epsilonproteobacteria bacterium]|nr:MAG: hypothetical protein DRG78_14345 [Campylobacterota bacterium]